DVLADLHMRPWKLSQTLLLRLRLSGGSMLQRAGAGFVRIFQVVQPMLRNREAVPSSSLPTTTGTRNVSIAAPIARALVEVVEGSGVPRHEFLTKAALSEQRLADGDERFTIQELDAIQRLALDVTRDEALGLHLAERASEAAFDVLGHLVSHAPTLRDA